MSYTLNQYSFMRKETDDFMTDISGAKPIRFTNVIEEGLAGEGEIRFFDETIMMDNDFTLDNHYYLHAKIKKENHSQTFIISLVNIPREEDFQNPNYKTQFLKQITVGAGNGWYDLELIFTPVSEEFNSIWFKLNRTAEDFLIEKRIPVIIYEELAEINNLIGTNDIEGAFVKMGIQSRPGLLMCLNGEEIHVGRTGVYEVRNGVVAVYFLSIISAGSEETIIEDGVSYNSIEDYLDAVAASPPVPYEEILMSTQQVMNTTGSKCLFENKKTHLIDSFSVDYMSKEEE